MKEDARVMVVLQSKDPLGYSLQAIALRELGHYEDAIKYYDSAIELMSMEDPKRIELYGERCEIYIRMGEYEHAIADAQECLEFSSDGAILHFYILCAQTALGNYEDANILFSQIVNTDPDTKRRFRAWSMKYVFDALEADRSWHPSDSKPEGIAFLAMLEAEEMYQQLIVKGGGRLITDGFAADWSPDGTKLAFSMGVYKSNGLAIFDMVTEETELLIVPGKHPKWSPDGQHIAFVREYDVLPLSELVAAERSTQKSSFSMREEVWIVQVDGTDPRRLVPGSWPTWSQDSKHVYYKDRLVSIPLKMISIEDIEAQPSPIMPGPSFYPSVSPDNNYVAYVESGTQWLKIVDMASQSLVADWVGPPRMWWGGNWSPTSRQFSLGGISGLDKIAGLWIYDLDERQAAKVLSGHITTASWAPDETQLAFCVGLPFHEIWVASLDPNMSTIEALGPSRTLEEHYQEMVDHYTRRIEADPNDADSYLRRAQYSYYLHDKRQADADMNGYRAIMNPLEGIDSQDRRMRASRDQKDYSGFQFGAPINLGPPINSSVDEWHMSLSADGLVLLFSSNRHGGYGQFDLWMSTRQTASDLWSEPVNLGPTVNTSKSEMDSALSPDGLKLYFSSKGHEGEGSFDIFVSKRESIDDNWGQSINLGSTVNSPKREHCPYISANGLELFFISFNRTGGHGHFDIWTSTRKTKDAPWEEAVNLGPPVNTKYEEAFPVLSSDGLLLFFSSGLEGDNNDMRPGGLGDSDIWVTRRKTKDADWQEPVNLGPPVNSAGAEIAPVISADGSTLYFSFDAMDIVPDRGSLGWIDLWQVSINPTPESLQEYGDMSSVKDLMESNDGKGVTLLSE
jgi:Tol biopolymer transport system component